VLPDALETARKQLNVWLKQQLSSGGLSAGPTS
jgi:hypothetical protein